MALHAPSPESGGTDLPEVAVTPTAASVAAGDFDPDAVDVGSKRSKRKRLGGYGLLFWAAVVWLGLVVFAAITATFLPIPDPNDVNVPDKLARPLQEGYFLGTDGLGRDIFSRLIHGARVSLTISGTAVVIGMLAGGTLGMVTGYFRGWFEGLVMGIINVVLAFPGLVLLLGLVAFVGQSLTAITMVVGVLAIPVYTRVARATTLRVAQREYVLAARAMGAKSSRILFREIAPNVFLPVAAFGLVALGTVIVLEGALAFLGLSVQPPAATWGSMISEGKRHLNDTGHVALIPSGVMFLTVLSLNFVGDTLRSKFDVKEAAL